MTMVMLPISFPRGKNKLYLKLKNFSLWSCPHCCDLMWVEHTGIIGWTSSWIPLLSGGFGTAESLLSNNTGEWWSHVYKFLNPATHQSISERVQLTIHLSVCLSITLFESFLFIHLASLQPRLLVPAHCHTKGISEQMFLLQPYFVIILLDQRAPSPSILMLY